MRGRQSRRVNGVSSGNEIATWFDTLTMSGCAPRDDQLDTWADSVAPFEEQGHAALGA